MTLLRQAATGCLGNRKKVREEKKEKNEDSGQCSIIYITLSSSLLDMDRSLFFRTSHLTNLRSHSETSPVKAGATNVRDNTILPPTVSVDGAGTCFVNTDCVTSPVMELVRASVIHCRFHLTVRRHVLKRLDEFCENTVCFTLFGGGTQFKTLGSHDGVGWELRRLY